MIVITHNQATQSYRQFIRVRLPTNKYKAQIWNKKSKRFVDVVSDIFE